MPLRQVSRENSFFYPTTLLFLLFVVGLLISCAAGSGSKADTSLEPDPFPKRNVKKEGNNGVLDVTNYYSRPEIKAPRGGAGLANFETENFIGSARCSICHDLLSDSEGSDMSILGHWRSTMMANAARDPLWQAKVSSEVKRNPGLKKVIEELTATCHMPVAWTQAYTRDADRLVLDNGLLSPKNALHTAAMDGVTCSLCHQIQDKNLGRKESFSGKFVIDTDKQAPEREIFGPYKDPVQRTMQKSVGFTPVYGAQINDSALCATCHTLFTPFVDGQGNVVSMPETAMILGRIPDRV